MTATHLAPRLSRCGSLVERFRALSGAPNVVVAITDRHRTMEVLRAGTDDRALLALAERPVPIGSITKTLAALALLRAATRHGVALEAPVAQFVPEFARPAWCEVQLAELLTHTSGLSIGSLAAPWSRRDLVSGTKLPRFADQRGRFYYSNLGYEALGKILENLEGRPFGDILDREVLRPLGMERTLGRLHPEDREQVPPGHAPTDRHALHWVGEPLEPAAWETHLGAAGGSAAPQEELTVLLRSMLLAHSEGTGPLAPEWQLALQPRAHCEPGVSYGLGLFRGHSSERDRAWHAGGVVGHRTLAMADLRHGFGIVVFTDLGGPLRGSLILRLGHQLLDLLASGEEGAIDYAHPLCQGLGSPLYATDGGAPLRFETLPDGWVVHLPDGNAGALQWTEDYRCMTDQPGWREFEFRLKLGPTGSVEEVLHGSRIFKRKHVEAAPATPLLRLAGLYRSRNPWAPCVRVTEGPLGPLIHVPPLEGPLVQLDRQCWRVDGTPEVVTFGASPDGSPLDLDLSGGLYSLDLA